VELFALPPQNEADRLLGMYFSTVNLMIPCVHEESFRTIYARLQSEGTRALSRPWLAVINMVFAIATNVLTPTSPPLNRVIQSDKYFQRATELVKPHLLGHPSLELSKLAKPISVS
jgi:hypothetical protein